MKSDKIKECLGDSNSGNNLSTTYKQKIKEKIAKKIDKEITRVSKLEDETNFLLDEKKK